MTHRESRLALGAGDAGWSDPARLGPPSPLAAGPRGAGGAAALPRGAACLGGLGGRQEARILLGGPGDSIGLRRPPLAAGVALLRTPPPALGNIVNIFQV